MDTESFRTRLRSREPLFGLALNYPAPGIIEGMCRQWDFVWIDGQHGQFAYDSALAAVQTAAGLALATVLRPPGDETGMLGLYADIAPSAVMVPMVNSAKCAAAIVDALCFPPLGQRSVGGRRFVDIHGLANPASHQPVVIAQIETPEAVDNAEGIIATEGVDMLFFGADDLRVRKGISLSTPAYENQSILEAMEKTAHACREQGKACGCVAGNSHAASIALQMGYRVIVGGGDIQLLRSGAAQRLEELRAAVESLDS